jgi:hypothetical protein
MSHRFPHRRNHGPLFSPTPRKAGGPEAAGKLDKGGRATPQGARPTGLGKWNALAGSRGAHGGEEPSRPTKWRATSGEHRLRGGRWLKVCRKPPLPDAYEGSLIQPGIFEQDRHMLIGCSARLRVTVIPLAAALTDVKSSLARSAGSPRREGSYHGRRQPWPSLR